MYILVISEYAVHATLMFYTALRILNYFKDIRKKARVLYKLLFIMILRETSCEALIKCRKFYVLIFVGGKLISFPSNSNLQSLEFAVNIR